MFILLQKKYVNNTILVLKYFTKLEYSYVINNWSFIISIHAQAQTKAQAWKVVYYFWSWCLSVRTKQNKLMKELNHFSS